MAFAKLSQTVRRSELLVLASLLAGLVMALFLMTVTWMTGEGLWAFPGLVAATAFRSLQAGGAFSFSWPQIAAGFGLHLLVALVLGGVFAWTSPRLRSAAGLDDVAETPAFGLLGLGFGIGAFATAWWGVLPSANPVLVQGLDATFFAVAHGIWGLCLGVSRKAWNQTAPYASRRPQASPSPEPTPAASSHKAPSSSAGAAAAAETQAGGVTTLTPEPDEGDDEAPDEDDEDEEEQTAVNRAGSNDELSPWPDPPEPDEGDDEETASDDGSPSSSSSSPSTTTSGAEDDEDEGVAMTEHARRSLKGLTGEEPDLPPVHRQLDTTLTHVAPGRAVCTIDAGERLHDATGAVQSGVLMSLAELAATVAMQTVAPDADHATVSSEVQVDGFVETGHVVAEAEVTEQAGTTTLAEVEVRDASGEVLVTASFQMVSDEDA